MSKIVTDSYRQQLNISIKAGVVKEIVFTDTKPNTIFILNKGGADISVSVSFSNPGIDNYELLVAGKGKQSLVKPKIFDRVYLHCSADNSVNIESFFVEDLRPADIPETQPVSFVNQGAITLGNISSIINPVQVETVVKTRLDEIKALLTQIEINTRP